MEVCKVEGSMGLICLILNILLPGWGTLLSTVLGEPKFDIMQIVFALLQWFTTWLLVGWIWSIYWGYLVCSAFVPRGSINLIQHFTNPTLIFTTIQKDLDQEQPINSHVQCTYNNTIMFRIKTKSYLFFVTYQLPSSWKLSLRWYLHKDI